jgi:peptidoglycan/xylan/chitin deacetylase (PgdA/CDA1 family)
METSALKYAVAPLFDAVGNRLLMSQAGDLGLAHRHGKRTLKRVALTFDDGPVLGGTEAVLDALAEQGVPGTFFFVGVNVRMHPRLVERAVREGHAVGGHSMNHSRFAAVSPFDGSHIDECMGELRAVLGRTPALYRPPWGWLTPWEVARLRRRGLAVIRWDLETPDWRVPCPSAASMVAWTLPRVRPGTIVVLHDGMSHAEHHPKPETARAVRLLVPALRAQGYEVVTIPNLLGIPAFQPPRGH